MLRSIKLFTVHCFILSNSTTLSKCTKNNVCFRSAYYQKAIKATARPLKIYSCLQWLFLLFGRLRILKRLLKIAYRYILMIE